MNNNFLILGEDNGTAINLEPMTGQNEIDQLAEGEDPWEEIFNQPTRSRQSGEPEIRETPNLLQLYMEEMGKIPMLSPDQEIALARKKNAGRT